MRISLLSLVLVAIAGGNARAIEVYPAGGNSSFPIMPNKPIESKSAKPVTVNIEFECAATNLRAPETPVATDGCITANVVLAGRSPEISVTFPGAYMDPYSVQLENPACRGPDVLEGRAQGIFNLNPPASWKKALTFINQSGGRLHLAVTTDWYPDTISVSDRGEYNITSIPTKVANFYMVQTGIVGERNGYTFGTNQPLQPVQTTIEVGAYGQEVNISTKVYGAAYAWQNWGVANKGHCGGYYSPLMLFFGKNRPKFHGVALFPLITEPRNYAWVEPNSPGFFLTMDKNHNGKIDSGEEMFGIDAKGKYRNGFERLKTIDSNHDGVIDARDAKFSELSLWQDKNGSGSTERGEIIPLQAKKVVKIELNYTSHTVTPMGGGAAELRERAGFSYLDNDGSLRQGEIVDVWLSPAPSPLPAVSAKAH